MIALDTNILVYAHRRDAPLHDAARALVADLAGGGAPWGIPWPCIHEFFSVVTHPRLFRPPSTRAEAVAEVDAWLGSPSVRLLHESPVHWETMRTLLEGGDVVGPMVHDARIAAVCLDHGVRALVTSDRDFSRFPALEVRPLTAPGRG